MEGVGHVDAVPEDLVRGVVDDVAGVGRDADGSEDIDERGSDPLGNVGPAFFAGDFGDLAAGGEGLEVGEGEGGRMGYEAVDL